MILINFMIIYLYTVIPGDAWGEQLHWLSKDIKRWCIIIGVLLSIFCLAQVCIHLWGSMKIFGKIFLNCYFRLISRVKTNYEIPVSSSIFGRNRKEKGQPDLFSFQLRQQYKSKQSILVFSHCLMQRKGQMS